MFGDEVNLMGRSRSTSAQIYDGRVAHGRDVCGRNASRQPRGGGSGCQRRPGTQENLSSALCTPQARVRARRRWRKDVEGTRGTMRSMDVLLMDTRDACEQASAQTIPRDRIRKELTGRRAAAKQGARHPPRWQSNRGLLGQVELRARTIRRSRRIQ